MLGVVAREPVALGALLEGAPRSLAALSIEHRDGWGLASTDDGRWTLRKGTRCAAECDDFRSAARGRARVAVAHVRKRTVGPTSLANTHPFQRGRWVLAHNGTVEDLRFLTSRSSRVRLDEIRGDTDSERLFSFLMTAIDRAVTPRDGIASAVRELRAARGVGAVSFLLSDGRDLYAHRSGRTLFLLDRTRDGGTREDRVREDRVREDRIDIRSGRAPSIAVASERLTDEPWREIEQGALVLVAGGAVPSAALVDHEPRRAHAS
jgi:glutamine amidotransferase